VTRARPLALASALAFLAAPAAASPGREVGRLAPEIHATAAWNAPGGLPTLRDHRGRLVLLEFFSVDCPHCRSAVPALDAISRAGASTGVRVVGASLQATNRIDAFVREQGVAFPVVRVPAEVVEDYEVTAYPEAFLVGTDGRVLWSGDPRRLDAPTLDRLRAQSPPWPSAVDGWAEAVARLRSDDASGARALLAACRVPASACPVDRERAADLLLGWIDAWASTLAGLADAEAARGDPYEAWRALDLLGRAFAGAPEGSRALARAERLLADARTRDEVEAGRALAEARRLLVAGERASAVAALDRLASDYEGTRAASRAAAIASRHRPR
jgi:hypothetical protein